MSEFEVVEAFLTYTESVDTHNDFKQYWSQMWKPITQKCLGVAKHQFVMKKAFELFKGKIILSEFKNKKYSWFNIFVRNDEENTLRTLCEHAGLIYEEFVFYGFEHHKNRCRKYFSKLNR